MIGVISLISILGYGATAHFYYTIFKEGVESEYIKISATDKNILFGIEKSVHDKSINQNIWKNTHVKNFKVPVPFSHPLVYVVPHAVYRYDHSEFGFSYQSMSGAEVFNFFEEKQELFKTEIDRNKLFSIPVVRDVIYDKSVKKIFRDLFARDIFFGHQTIPELTKNLYLKILKSDWKDLVYNLFIYKLRVMYFDYENIEQISWDSEHSVGIISFIKDKTGEKNNILYFLQEGMIYKVRIRYKDWNGQSKKIRSLFISNIEFANSREDASISIYGDYRLLDFKKQTGHDGMVFLFSAWSHHHEDHKFLKEMIHRLERGKGMNEQLRVLYKYSLSRYKRTFSSKEDVREEDSTYYKIEDQALLEVEESISKEQRQLKNYQQMEETDFNSAEDKMDYYLDEALRKEQ